jgi:hypothetical protein
VKKGMRKTLIDELGAARRDRKYRGPCRVTDRPDSDDIRPVPREIRAVVATWNRKSKLATKSKRGRRQRPGVYYLLMQEARSFEYLMCDWLRAYYKLGKNSRITVCSKWRCSISHVG